MELKVESITKKYGKQLALDRVNCSFEEGVYGILGPNGAGKTTLISILTGILKQTSGNVYYDGVRTDKLDVKYLEQIGYSPQYPIFYKNFKVEEFLQYMCALKAIPKKRGKKRIQEVLELVNLTDASKKYIGALSGGMRQRLSVAQAILNEPGILVLDEPTAGLDPGERIRFRNIISRLSHGRIVLITTHIVSDIEYIANEVLIMKQGHLIKKDKVECLLEEIINKVWCVQVDTEEINNWTEKYLISNIKQEGDYVNLRILSEDRPCQEAVSISPQLEDVFLKVYGNIEGMGK